MAELFKKLRTDVYGENVFFLRYNLDFGSEENQERRIYFYGTGTSEDNIEWVWEYSEFWLEDIPGIGLAPNIHIQWSVEGIFIAMADNKISLSELDSGKINADNYPPLLPSPMSASGDKEVEKINIGFEEFKEICENNNGIWALAYPPQGLEHMGPKPFRLDQA